MPANKTYLQFVQDIKQQILQSRYQAARLVNRELLLLYYSVGKGLSQKIAAAKWGSKVLENISADLQKELPGLRGFSVQNLKKMRIVYEFFGSLLEPPIGSTVSNQSVIEPGKKIRSKSSTVSNQIINPEVTELFFQLGFSHLFLLAISAKNTQELLFYMQQAVQHRWSFRLLQHHIQSKFYHQKGKLPNNFEKTLPKKLAATAMDSFKDEYLLDFININPDDDERVLESEIINNIKHFILSLGTGFTFIGNQHRLVVDDDEFFTDLLFFNRRLQCLVAFELKKGKFKPDHAGKLNFYLNVLDEQVKLPHENSSIGIILCREKNNKVVEYAFKSIDKAMGVATYKTSSQLPAKYKKILPDAESLKKLLK